MQRPAQILPTAVLAAFGFVMSPALLADSAIDPDQEVMEPAGEGIPGQEQQQQEQLQIDLGDPEEQLPLDDLRQFTEVFERIKRGYVEEISDRELLEKAIEGMLSGLDPHSAYMQPDALSDLEESTTGEFGGLGIEVGMEDGYVRVIAPIDDTPAHEAGLQPGDLIAEIDGQPVQGISLEDAVSKMRGEPGTSITLTIVREGESAPFEVELERDVIQVVSVRSRLLEEDYGYMRISQFQQKTGEDFRKAFEEIKEENERPLKGMILDLRNNPGGVLEAAVEVSDALLNDGRIVYTEGRIENSQLSFNASEGDITDDLPIVVLINAGSASASEIVAGALQDHGRAVIMGTDSFGKGSVQTIMPLASGHGIKLTTARYFTPDGRSIQAKGIEPDITVRQAEVRDVEEEGRGFTEADLRGHLDDGGDPDEMPEQEAPEARDQDDEDRDYQLRSALNLLKGMAILDRRRAALPGDEAEQDHSEENDNND